ncbi:type VI secretion protein [Halopseudomonas phragmitis]|uniref:Type VI secretion protein n=1 Tax=Pseudomonas jilinensis TaxID=2078689 RepID=A0A396RUA1_9PSED|nr:MULTISPECIES: type VI secretion protein [Pseudomonadaceae]PAU87432.1 type VI secretion protein [Pseudomonas sp. WN033]RHW20108.1 type VI secretion protein [Pseudomonas jilinensis]
MRKSIWSIVLLSLALLAGTGCTGNHKDYRPLGEPQATRGN